MCALTLACVHACVCLSCSPPVVFAPYGVIPPMHLLAYQEIAISLRCPRHLFLVVVIGSGVAVVLWIPEVLIWVDGCGLSLSSFRRPGQMLHGVCLKFKRFCCSFIC